MINKILKNNDCRKHQNFEFWYNCRFGKGTQLGTVLKRSDVRVLVFMELKFENWQMCRYPQ